MLGERNKKYIKKINLWPAIVTAVMDLLFLAFAAVSGSSSTEESCTGTYAYLESVGIPSLLGKESLLDVIPCCKCLFVDVKQCRDA